MNLPFEHSVVSRQLLAWYSKAGRDLPWRHTRNPYRIWLSEIMLQQTTVVAVIPYYERFLEKFPTVKSLAEAPLDDVITLWAGLGYYSRARNLHKAARIVIYEMAGVFPNTLEGLLALPGIGKSTAGAILSIAFDKPAPILDGNVRRVLVRLIAWQDDPRSSRTEKKLWGLAEVLTPDKNPHDYTQAIMDLGATVCTPRKPDCESCPLKGLCLAYAGGLADELPLTRKRKPSPVRNQASLIIVSPKGILLRKRPEEGFLGGLWELPTRDCHDGSPSEAASSILNEAGMSGPLHHAADVKHAYSHFRLELTVFRTEVAESLIVAENDELSWVALDDLKQLALHGAHKKALAALQLV